jgi:hypothetical protein
VKRRWRKEGSRMRWGSLPLINEDGKRMRRRATPTIADLP